MITRGIELLGFIGLITLLVSCVSNVQSTHSKNGCSIESLESEKNKSTEQTFIGDKSFVLDEPVVELETVYNISLNGKKRGKIAGGKESIASVIPSFLPSIDRTYLLEPDYHSVLDKTSYMVKFPNIVLQEPKEPILKKKKSKVKKEGTVVKTKTSDGTVGQGNNEELNRIQSAPNEKIAISLPGRGWIFLGFKPDSATDSNSITFLGKKNTNGRNVFTFVPHSNGIYTLSFINQDILTSDVKKRKVVLDVSGGERSVVGASEGKEFDKNEKPPVSAKIADYFFQNGQYDQALKEYIRINSSNEPYINDRIASIYFKKGEYQVAEKYWKRNIETKNKYYDHAILGLIASQVEEGEIARTIDYMKELETGNIELRNSDHVYIRVIVNKLSRNGYYKLALEFLKWYEERRESEGYKDWIKFMLGQIYENSEKYRNFDKAISYYEKIIDLYPWSEYYDVSLERLRYLKRHFLYVR